MKDQNYENSRSHVSFSMTGIERYVAACVRQLEIDRRTYGHISQA